MRKELCVWCSLMLAMLLGAGHGAAVEIPITSDKAGILPAHLNEVVMGAPADSLVLRVSFYGHPGDGRFDTWAEIVIEELVWPFPPTKFYMDPGDGERADRTEPSEPQVVLAASRIEGDFLNQERRKEAEINRGFWVSCG